MNEYTHTQSNQTKLRPLQSIGLQIYIQKRKKYLFWISIMFFFTLASHTHTNSSTNKWMYCKFIHFIIPFDRIFYVLHNIYFGTLIFFLLFLNSFIWFYLSFAGLRYKYSCFVIIMANACRNVLSIKQWFDMMN